MYQFFKKYKYMKYIYWVLGAVMLLLLIAWPVIRKRYGKESHQEKTVMHWLQLLIYSQLGLKVLDHHYG